MAHSQAEKPAGVRPVGRNLDGSEYSGLGGWASRRNDEAGWLVTMGRLAKGGNSSTSSSNNTSEYGCEAVNPRLAEMPYWSVVLAQVLGGWNQRVGGLRRQQERHGWQCYERARRLRPRLTVAVMQTDRIHLRRVHVSGPGPRPVGWGPRQH